MVFPNYKFLAFVCIFFGIFLPNFVFAENLSVPFLSQVPPGNWNSTRNCGPVSALMVGSYFNGLAITSESIVQLDDWMFLSMGRDKRDYNGDYTNVGDLKKISVEYLKIPADDIEIKRGEDLEDLKNNLKSGNPIIVGVYTNMKLRDYDDDPTTNDSKHFMVLVGMDDEYVYVHDPGKTRGANNQYTIEQFKIAWAGNNYAYIVFKKADIVPETVIANEPSPVTIINQGVKLEQQQASSFLKRTWNSLSTFLIQSLKRMISAVPTPEQQEQIENANSNVSETQTEEVTAPVERVYGARFLQREIPISFVKGAKQVRVSMEIENTGTAVWEKNTVSLNVVGGRTSNAMWYHPTWVTQLRPVIVSQRVESGQKATVSFTVTIPEIDRQLRLQLVRPEGGTYVQVGTMLTTIVLSEVVVPPPSPVLPSSTPSIVPPISQPSDEDVSPDTQTESTAVVTPFVDTPSMFVRSGGGGGQNRDTEEGDVLIEEEEDMTLTTTPTSTDPTPTSTPTSTEPVVTSTDPLPELSDIGITTPVDPAEVVYTNEGQYVFVGTSDEYTETVVVTKDDVVLATTTPSGGVWEVPITLAAGTQSLVLYGSASEGRHTSSTTIIVVYDAEAPFVDMQLLTVGEGSIVVDLMTYDDSPIERYEVEFFDIVQYGEEEIVCEDGLFLFETPRFQYYLEGDEMYVEIIGNDYFCGSIVHAQTVVEPIVSAPYDQSYVIVARVKALDISGNESEWWYSAVPLAFPDIGDVEISL